MALLDGKRKRLVSGSGVGRELSAMHGNSQLASLIAREGGALNWRLEKEEAPFPSSRVKRLTRQDVASCNVWSLEVWTTDLPNGCGDGGLPVAASVAASVVASVMASVVTSIMATAGSPAAASHAGAPAA